MKYTLLCRVKYICIYSCIGKSSKEYELEHWLNGLVLRLNPHNMGLFVRIVAFFIRNIFKYSNFHIFLFRFVNLLQEQIDEGRVRVYHQFKSHCTVLISSQLHVFGPKLRASNSEMSISP